MCGNIRQKNFDGPSTSTLVTTTAEIPTTTMIDSNGSVDDIPKDSEGIILSHRKGYYPYYLVRY